MVRTEEYGLGILLQRHGAVVLKHYDAFFGSIVGCLVAGLPILGIGKAIRLFHAAELLYQLEHSKRGSIKIFHGKPAVFDCLYDVRMIPGTRHKDVLACCFGIACAPLAGIPVGHCDALIAPLTSQHSLKQPEILMAVDTVDLRICAHQGRSHFAAGFKRGEIDLP